MTNAFRTIEPQDIKDNVFKLIGDDWMLITAGPPENYNTMTGGWGGFGVIWGKNVCWCFIRPHRHTYEFMERSENFTLSFFDENYRPALELCGTKSGRDTDKAAEAGITPIAGTVNGTTAFAEARLIIQCKKIYSHDFDPGRFLDPSIDQCYPESDYHRAYIGEVIGCLSR